MRSLIVTLGILGTPVAAYDADLANSLFDEFCIPYDNAAASETAIAQSGRFGQRRETVVGSARYVSFPIPGVRGVITVTYEAAGRIQCSVGIENKGPTLYENGRVTRE